MSSFSESQTRGSSRENKINTPSHSVAAYSIRPKTQDDLSNIDSFSQLRANRIGASFYHSSETSEDTISTQNNVILECSSDNSSIIRTRPVKRRKRSVNTLVSSSESSNSGAPRQIERATSKRIRLFSSSDGNSSSTLRFSNHANENKDTALTSGFENKTSPHKQRKRRRKRRRRSKKAISNQQTAQTQRMLILSRHNWVITPSKNNPQSTRQTDASDIRSNTTRVRNSRPSASTNTASQNTLLSGNRQSRRMTSEILQSTTSEFPARRRNVKFVVTNSPNFSSGSNPNSHLGRRPNYSDQRNNSRTVLNRHSTSSSRSLIDVARRPHANQRHDARTSVTRQYDSDSDSQNRTVRNRDTVGRTSINPTPVTAPMENMTCAEPPVTSNEDTGYILRPSIWNDQNVTCVRNPSTELRAESDTDNSSSSSINELRPVVLNRRRVIFSSDNSTSSDSDASSIVVNRVRRPVQIVVSDSESEENAREKEVEASGNVDVIHSDTDSETEKCPICFGRFERQEIGTPKTCKHCFCFGCIKKWSENNNTCPVDRQTFDSIIVRSTVQGEVVREEPVPPPEMPNRFSDDDSFSDNIISASDFDFMESDYNVDDLPDDDMDYDALEYDEDYNGFDYGFDEFVLHYADSDQSEYDLDYESPDNEVDYDVPEYDGDYDSPDNDVDYDTPDNNVDYDTPDNDEDHEAPDVDEEYDPPDYDEPDEICDDATPDNDTADDNDVEYDTPDNDVGYDTPDNDVDYDTPDNEDYDTPDNDVDYHIRDNNTDHEAPYADEEYDPPDYDGPDEICVVCSTGDGEEMIICDLCNNVYHLQCLDPPLQEIPVNFRCLECKI